MSKFTKQEKLEVDLGDFTELKYSEDIENNYVTEAMIEEAGKKAKEAKAAAQFNLDGALDGYDPTFPRYTPTRDALEFFVLMRLVEGTDFEFNTPIAHYFMVDLLLGNIKDTMQFPYTPEICKTIELNPLRIAFIASRGVAKSSVVISFFGVYSAIKGTLPNGIGPVWFYLVIAASSRGGARVNALAVRAMCEDSAFIKDYFESVRFTESESEFVRKDPTGKIPKKNRSFLIRYQGAGTGIRGIRYGQRRICMILLDDIILNEAAAYSKTITGNLTSMIQSDAIAALKGGNTGRVVNCFTPFNYGDVNTRTVLEGSYTPCVIPIAKSFDPMDETLKATDIVSTWESYHPRVSIMQMVKEARKSNSVNKLMQERMLRLTSASDRLVPENCIQFCDMGVIEKNLDGYNIYITTDYTTTSGENSDFSGIATWAVNSNEDWFMLNLSLRKMGMDTQYELTLQDADKYRRKGKYVELGVEVDGNQSAHINALEKLMRQRGTYHPFAKQKGQLDSGRKGILSRATGVAKHERFRIASQVLLQNKMWFPEHLKSTPDMREFLEQLRGVTHENFTRADDGCFTADTLIEMEDGTQKEIQYIKEGDRIVTSSSTSAIAKASDAMITGVKEVRDYYLSDGTIISMTDNHPVYTTNGWKYAEDLTSDHKIVEARKCKNKSRNLNTYGLQKELDTTNQQKRLRVKEDGYINGHGSWKMVLSQQDMTYIIKTITKIITTSVTWNCSLQKSMLNIIKEKRGLSEMKRTEKRMWNTLITLDILLQNGIVQMKVENGIKNIEWLWEALRLLRTNRELVDFVEKSLCIGEVLEQCTVIKNVSMLPIKNGIKIQLKKSVSSVIMSTQQTEQIEEIPVLESVLRSLCLGAKNCLQSLVTVGNAVKSSLGQKDPGIAVKDVEILQQARKDINRTEHLKVEPALNAEQYLKATAQQLSTVGRSVELVTIIGKSEKRKEVVYNFTVKGTETYLVNGGVIVHNCDLIAMGITSMNVIYPTYEAGAGITKTDEGIHYYGTMPDRYSSVSAYDSY